VKIHRLIAAILAAACVSSDTRAPDSAVNEVVLDCLGGPKPQITVGHVGALDLTLTLRELKQRCPTIRDTTAHGDESLDTAIVISRSDLNVIGRIATVACDGCEGKYVVDSARRISTWTVTGTGAMLPEGVSLSATYDSLVRAYGKPFVLPLNGDVTVGFCEKARQYGFHVYDRLYHMDHPVITPDSYPSSLKGARITEVDVPGYGAGALSTPCGPGG
jgi:hypothetical protein